jgi:hypothetical protein
VLHVLEQLLGLEQERDIQDHIAVSWGKDASILRGLLMWLALPSRVPQRGETFQGQIYPEHQPVPVPLGVECCRK